MASLARGESLTGQVRSGRLPNIGGGRLEDVSECTRTIVSGYGYTVHGYRSRSGLWDGRRMVTGVLVRMMLAQEQEG